MLRSVYESAGPRPLRAACRAAARSLAAAVSGGTRPSSGSITSHGCAFSASKCSYQWGGPAPVSLSAVPPMLDACRAAASCRSLRSAAISFSPKSAMRLPASSARAFERRVVLVLVGVDALEIGIAPGRARRAPFRRVARRGGALLGRGHRRQQRLPRQQCHQGPTGPPVAAGLQAPICVLPFAVLDCGYGVWSVACRLARPGRQHRRRGRRRRRRGSSPAAGA